MRKNLQRFLIRDVEHFVNSTTPISCTSSRLRLRFLTYYFLARCMWRKYLDNFFDEFGRARNQIYQRCRCVLSIRWSLIMDFLRQHNIKRQLVDLIPSPASDSESFHRCLISSLGSENGENLAPHSNELRPCNCIKTLILANLCLIRSISFSLIRSYFS